MKMDKVYKLVLVGDAGVGKSTFVNFNKMGFFQKNYLSTIGLEVCPLKLNTDDGEVCFSLFDCSGQNKFKPRSDFYRSMECAIVMFSINSPLSFKSVTEWVNSIRNSAPKIPIVLCGTKNDLHQKITDDEIYDLSNRLDLCYFQISTKNNLNLQLPLLELARLVTKLSNFTVPLFNDSSSNFTSLGLNNSARLLEI